MGNNISSIFRTVSTPVANFHPRAWAACPAMPKARRGGKGKAEGVRRG